MKRIISVLLAIWQAFWPILLLGVISIIVNSLLYPALDYQILTIVADLLAFVILYLFYRSKRSAALYAAGQPSSSSRSFSLTSALFLAVFAAVSCFVLNELIFLTGIGSAQYQETSEILYSGGLLSQFILMVVAGPLAEELIFRGFCYGRLKAHLGVLTAGVLSAILFGVFHGNVVQGLYGFFIGLLLVLVYEKYGGLRASIWFHACANLTSVLLTALLDQVLDQLLPLAADIILIVCAVLMGLFIWVSVKKAVKSAAKL